MNVTNKRILFKQNTQITPEKIIIFSIIIGICFYIIAIISQEKVYNADTVWVFENAYLMKRGLLPYRDFNTITSPLFLALSYLALHPFNTIKGVKTVEVVLSLIGIFCAVKITKYKKEYLISAILAILLIRTSNFEYNYVVLIYSLFIYAHLAQNKLLTYKSITFMSIIAYLGTGTKITYGLIMTFACLICIIYTKDIKKIVTFITIYVGLTGLSLFYIYHLGIWQNFYDCCIYPITNHVSSASYNPAVSIIIIACVAIINLRLLIFMFKYYIKHELDLFAIFSYAMFSGSIINIFPTFNEYHLMIILCHFVLFVMAILKYRNNVVQEAMLFNFAFFASFIMMQQVYSIPPQISSVHEYISGEDILLKDGDVVNRIISYLDSSGEDNYLIISGYSAAINYFRNGSYNKYTDMMIEGNIGTRDPVEIIKEERNKYDGIIFPLSDELTYDKLLDARITKYLAEINAVQKIMVKDGIYYGASTW